MAAKVGKGPCSGDFKANKSCYLTPIQTKNRAQTPL
jgi:hypothetical protein